MRRSYLIPAVFALFAAGASHALGFGELSLNSALNQPLDATVELLAVKPSERDTVKVRIADPDIFERFGLSRSPALDDVQIEVVPVPGSNRLRVDLSTRRPVREPFLSLLLEADWQGGRALREYTVLLDPPVQAPAARVPASTAAETPAEREPAAVREPEPARTTPAPAPARTRQAPAPQTARTTGSESRRYGPVVNNQTLWGIAREVRPDRRIGMNQMLVAIYRANPQAFDDNMNRLYAGATLSIPDAEAIRAIDRNTANREVAEQTRALENGGATRTASTRSRPEAAPAAEAPPSRAGELRLEPPAPVVEETATIDLAAGEDVAGEAASATGSGGVPAGEEAAEAEAAGAAENAGTGGTGEGAGIAEQAPGIAVAEPLPVREAAPDDASVVPEGSEGMLTWRNILLALAVLALAATPFLWLRRRQQYETLSEDFSTPLGGAAAAAEEEEPEPETEEAPYDASVEELLSDENTSFAEVSESPEPSGPPEPPEEEEAATVVDDESDTASASEEFELDFDFGDETAAGENEEGGATSVGGPDAAPPTLDIDFSEFESREEETAETDAETDDVAEPRDVEGAADEVPEEDEFADFDFDTLSLEETDTVATSPESDETAAEEGDVATKLDLARAYLDMGEVDMARGLLEEVKDQGNAEQRREAEDLLERAG